MYDPDANASPINPLPTVVVVLLLVMAGVEAVFQLAEAGFIGGPEAIGWRLEYSRQYAFFDPIFDWMLENRRFPAEHMIRLVTYSFVHAGFTHALMVAVFTAALGKFVGEVLGSLAVAVVFFASAIIGAIGFSMILDAPYLLMGGYPAVYGLIGAFTWILYAGLTAKGQSGIQAFRLIAFFMAIQLIWKLVFGGNDDWLAEGIGFVTGFGLAILLSPGSVQSMIARVRSR